MQRRLNLVFIECEAHEAPAKVVHVLEIIDTELSGSLVFSIRFV